MCGIAGVWTESSGNSAELSEAGRIATAKMAHRGPDGAGVWVDEGAGLVLAQTRLAILDLSEAGAQPMESADGRFMIVYNGEIYETESMRSELEASGVRFRGHSDTEILLEACAAWGVSAVLPRIVGMFAFALWDRRDRCLTLARDRFGIKPLYFGTVGNAFAFASELKPITALFGDKLSICEDALLGFLLLGHVPAPRAIYRSIQKLPPGAMATIRDGSREARVDRWWKLESILDVPNVKTLDPRAYDDQELELMIARAVRCRMVADVPLGAFLSGGIDSSLVAAMMQAQSSRPIKTFTIGFEEAAFDESRYAAKIAQHLGTDHLELSVTPAEAMAVIPQLPKMYDEPFADSSQIPTFLVSRLARQHVTVALSGDGGDELFAGYARHQRGLALWQALSLIPTAIKRPVASMICTIAEFAHQRADRQARAASTLGIRAERLASFLGAQHIDEVYGRLVSVWGERDWPSRSRLPPGYDYPPSVGSIDPLTRLQQLDAALYLPDDILTKVDRASMAVGLEARVPLLDHRVARLAFAVPPSERRVGTTGKMPLRKILQRYIPNELFDRPKKGFGIPVGEWIKGPLRDWAEDLLNPAELEGIGLRPDRVARVWREHLAGLPSRDTEMWTILTLRSWQRSLRRELRTGA